MRKICTFNLDIDLVKDMNKSIRRGHRSKFVETAITEKLNRKAQHELHDYKTTELLMHIRNTRFSSLNDLDKSFLVNLVDRLLDKGE